MQLAKTVNLLPALNYAFKTIGRSDKQKMNGGAINSGKTSYRFENLIGLISFGTFAPALVGLAFRDVHGLPGILVFSLGLSMTVAPLTAAILADADESNAGIASGVNNAVARVAGLLAIAALGAVVAASFASSLDDALAGQRLSPAAERVARTALPRSDEGAAQRDMGLERLA